MKKNRVLFFSLMFQPMAITMLCLPFLPAQIPLHFIVNYQSTALGSKYEILIFPLLSVAFGLFLLGVGKSSETHDITDTTSGSIGFVSA